jgi:glycosyltransferase involved in cell wall biosynthesis
VKKKIFLVVSSLGPGGSERVFWLLSQGINKAEYEVSLVMLDSSKKFLSRDIPNVNIIDLNTSRASRSFIKLYRLINREKPYAVFSTSTHINLLVALVAVFVSIPKVIARESNIYTEMSEFATKRARIFGYSVNLLYRRFNFIICQSEEMKESFLNRFEIKQKKLVVIPNPVLSTKNYNAVLTNTGMEKLLMVARLSPEKSHSRLLKIFSMLPEKYHLTIAGDGICKDDIIAQVKKLNIEQRVSMIGLIANVDETVSKHDLFLLTSVTEGFPNAALEALAMGIPVISFKVGGIASMIRPGFNGYIVEQDDIKGFKQSIIKASSISWDHEKIREDALARFSLQTVANQYTNLIC